MVTSLPENPPKIFSFPYSALPCPRPFDHLDLPHVPQIAPQPVRAPSCPILPQILEVHFVQKGPENSRNFTAAAGPLRRRGRMGIKICHPRRAATAATDQGENTLRSAASLVKKEFNCVSGWHREDINRE